MKRSHSSRHDERRSKSKKCEDYPFDTYRRDFHRIFFDDTQLVSDHNDFWLFVRKYESFQKKLEERKRGTDSELDPRDLIKLKLKWSDEELYNRIPFRDSDYGPPTLSKKRVKEFSTIILTYLDFKQKEIFQKVVKLRQAQQNLPVYQFKNEIIEIIKNERVVIIAGDTGCGKSTQIPQYLVQAGFNRIACTQPRRIACISLSKRVAFETLNEYGSEIGYQIRFEKNRRQETKIVFITEGLLLRQAATDGMLSTYEVIVLDEIHERHLHGDFLLGILKCLLHQREDFKLILMSATINLKLFSNYFGDNAKVIQVPGRLHPIKVHYHPINVLEKSSKSERIDPGPASN